MKKEFIYFNTFFEPAEDFKNFYESIGYTKSDIINSPDAWFDERIVKYVKEHLNREMWNFNGKIMEGAKDYRFRIGFAGAAYPMVVDTDRPWRVTLNNDGGPVVKYIRVSVDKFGQMHFFVEEEEE